MTVVAADAVLWVGIVEVVATVALLLLVIAPWKSVRNEPPLDDDVEARLLLGEDPLFWPSLPQASPNITWRMAKKEFLTRRIKDAEWE